MGRPRKGNEIILGEDHVGIVLNDGSIALIDPGDLELIKPYTWSARQSCCAYGYLGGSYNARFATMHRLIMGAPQGTKVYHINGNGLDNRRANLTTERVDRRKGNRTRDLDGVIAVELTQGKTTFVDEGDWARLKDCTWFALKEKNNWYARGYRRLGFRRYKTVGMHRAIMEAKDGIDVDHINGDGLDNRRANLRLCTRGQNLLNARSRLGASKHKGVYFNKRRKKWVARIALRGKAKTLGYFENETTAAMVYDDAARALHGEFACLNFPRDGKPSAVARAGVG